MKHDIPLQPKQSGLLWLIKNHDAVVIGVGGGRGAAKSSGADRIAITLMYEQKGMLGCMMMRNFDQVYKYHIEPIGRDFEWLESNLKKSMPASLKIGKSQLDFSYAENYDDIERRFRSGNYHYVFIDQAEQFSEREIREIRKATRMKGGGQAKVILLFNMRGSGIQTLRKWFHTHEVNKDEDPNDYAFIKFNPWDNVEWVRKALAEDGYTEFDYYAWTDDQRKDYAAVLGPYTKQLATDDEVIRAADWLGGWDSLEGAYFATAFDLESTRVAPSLIAEIRKPWSSDWLSQDWGKSHWCSSHWHFRVTLSPSEVAQYLKWKPLGIDANGRPLLRKTPLNIICTHREMIVSELTSTEVARKLIECTPLVERPKIKAYFLSPEEVTDDPNTIGSQQGKELRPFGMPGPSKADNERKGGWALMSKLLKATKEQGIDPDGNEHADAWLISSECVELLKAIPMAMRDPKNLDDVLKTDKSQAKIEQDVLDDVRYGLKSMLQPKKKTEEDKYQEKMQQSDPASRLLIAFRHEQNKMAKKRTIMPPSWKGNLR